MKKVIIIVALLLLLTVSAAAYENTYPFNAPFAGGAYIEVQCSPLGRALIYIPINYKDHYFSTNNGGQNLMNISNSTITGEIYYGTNFNEHTQIRFQRFSSSEYYYNYTGTSYRWDPVTTTAIYNTNMQISNQSSEPVQLYDKNMIISLILVFLVGVAVVCLFFKRSHN